MGPGRNELAGKYRKYKWDMSTRLFIWVKSVILQFPRAFADSVAGVRVVRITLSKITLRLLRCAITSHFWPWKLGRVSYERKRLMSLFSFGMTHTVSISNSVISPRLPQC